MRRKSWQGKFPAVNPKPLKLGSLLLKTPVLLAPMAGYTDWSFRVGIRALGGVGLAFTEMLAPETLLYGNAEIVRALTFTTPEDQPLGYQIYGKDPDLVARAARWLEERGAKLIDVNMGCPQKKLSARGRGAGLLRTPELAVQIVAAVQAAVTVPVTVKMRLGWENRDTAAQLAAQFARMGVAAVTVHGRTRVQGFSGSVDLEGIRRVVEAAPDLPVIANGDIRDVDFAFKVLRQTGAAGLMLGREPLANPWILRDIACALGGEPPRPSPTPDERVRFMVEHFERLVWLSGERNAVIRFRKWIRLYVRGRSFERADLLRAMAIEDARAWHAFVPGWVRAVWSAPANGTRNSCAVTPSNL